MINVNVYTHAFVDTQSDIGRVLVHTHTRAYHTLDKVAVDTRTHARTHTHTL